MTRFGPLDVLGKIGTGHAAAGRGYDELVPESALLAVGTLRVQVLGLRGLIRSKKEAGRDKDRAVLAILQRAPTNILQRFVAAMDLIVAESRVAVALRSAHLLQFPHCASSSSFATSSDRASGQR